MSSKKTKLLNSIYAKGFNIQELDLTKQITAAHYTEAIHTRGN